jgi:hypothetical protein
MTALLGAATFALSGLLFIIFWATANPHTAFYGAAAAPNPIWNASQVQVIHCIAAIAGLLGAAGVHGLHAPKTGAWGLIGTACALVGQACFFADGVIAYDVFPPIARALPATVDLDGFMFTGPKDSAYTAFAILFMIGYIVLGLSLLYFRALPAAPAPFLAEASAGALIVGGILVNLPPTAGFGGLCAGGIIWGAGASVLGALWAHAAVVAAGANPAKQEADGDAVAEQGRERSPSPMSLGHRPD